MEQPLDPVVRAILGSLPVMAIVEETPASVATTATARTQESSSDDVSPGQANPSLVDVLASDDSGPTRVAAQAPTSYVVRASFKWHASWCRCTLLGIASPLAWIATCHVILLRRAFAYVVKQRILINAGNATIQVFP